MELNEFIRKFADQFDDADINALSAKTAFRDIEDWSSLVALYIIGMVDEEYGVRLRGDDIMKSITIEDIYNIVKSRE